MSDSFANTPYEPGSPEEALYLQQQMHGVRAFGTVGIPSLARGALAEVLPSFDDSGSIASRLPAFMNQAYGMADLVKQAGARYLPDAIAPSPTPLPGADASMRAIMGSRENAAAIIPNTATVGDPQEAGLQTAMENIGGAMTSLPLGGATPKLVKAATGFLLPAQYAPGAAAVMSAAGSVAAPRIAGMLAPTSANAQTPVQAQEQDDTQKAVGVDTPTTQIPAPPAGMLTPDAPTTPGIPPLPPQPPTPPLGMNDSSLTYGLVAAGAVGTLIAIKWMPSMAESIMNIAKGSRMARTVEAGAELNSYLDNRSTLTSSGPLPEAPVPGQGLTEHPLVGATGAVQDDTAPLRTYLRTVAINPTIGDKLASQYGVLHSDSGYTSRIGAFAESGYDPGSGVQLRDNASNAISFDSHWQKITALSDQDRALYNEARVALDEQDNRLQATRTALSAAPPGTTVPEQRVGFSHVSSADLRAVVAQARANPAVFPLLDEANALHRGLIRIAEQRGYFSPQEAGQIIGLRPNYLPSPDVNGRILNPFERRVVDPNSNADVQSIPAWEADKQHVVEFMRTLENNDARAMVINQGMGFQIRNTGVTPTGAVQGPGRIIEPSKDATGNWVEKADGSSLPIRINGEPQHYVINSPQLRRLLDSSPTQLGTIMSGLSAMRGTFQRNITGLPGMVLGGYAFPLVNAARGAFLGAIDRPAGTSFGLLDAGVNKLSGGRFGLQGDPTGVLGMAYSTGADLTALAGKTVGNMITKGADNPVNNLMRGVFPDAVVDAMQQRLRNAYLNSLLFERKQLGISGSEGYGSQELPIAQVGGQGNVAGVSKFNPLNNTSVDLFRSYDPNVPLSDIRLKGVGKALVPILKFNNFLRDAFDIVNSSAQSHFHRLNTGELPGFGWADKGLDQAEITDASRQLTGDMGAKGGSSVVRNTTALVPFANPIIQDVSRLAKAVKESPFAVASGLTILMGIAAHMQVFSAMLSGQPAIDHMQNQMSEAQSAGNLTIYHPSLDPTEATQFSWPQRVRGAWPLFLQGAQDWYGVGGHFLSEESQQSVLHHMAEFFGTHITYETGNRMLEGLSSTFELSPGPVIGSMFAAAGKDAKLSISRMMEPNNKSIVDRIVSNAGGGSVAGPGMATDVDPTTASVEGKALQGLTKSFFGTTGEAVVNMMNAWGTTHSATGSNEMSFDHMIERWEQQVRDRNPMLNGLLWNNEAKLTFNTPLVQRTENKLAALELTKSAKSDLTMQGGIRRGSDMQLPATADEVQKVNPDPAMRNLYIQMSLANASIRQHILPAAMDVSKQIRNLDNSGMSPTIIRAQQNALMPTYQQRMGKVYDTILDLEYGLSQQVGGHVSVEHIDWKKDSSQFRKK